MSTNPFGVMIDIEFLAGRWVASALIPTSPKRMERLGIAVDDKLSVLVQSMEQVKVLDWKGVSYDAVGVMLSDLARLLLGHDPEAYAEWNGEPVAEVMVD